MKGMRSEKRSFHIMIAKSEANIDIKTKKHKLGSKVKPLRQFVKHIAMILQIQLQNYSMLGNP